MAVPVVLRLLFGECSYIVGHSRPGERRAMTTRVSRYTNVLISVTKARFPELTALYVVSS